MACARQKCDNPQKLKFSFCFFFEKLCFLGGGWEKYVQLSTKNQILFRLPVIVELFIFYFFY